MSDLHLRLHEPVGAARATIVAVHGLAESAETLDQLAAAWAAAGFRVVAVDQRGHGGSPRWTPEQLAAHPGDVIADDLGVILDDLHAPLLVVGHSSGGSAVAAAAAVRCVRIAGVLLEDPFWRLPVTRHQDRDVAAQAAADLRGLQAMTVADRERTLAGRARRVDPIEIAAAARAKLAADPALIANGDVIPSTPWPDLLATLRRHGVPTLIITGTVSTGILAEHQRIATAAGARVEVRVGATHFIRRDAPAWFATRSIAFFDDCLAASASSWGTPRPSG